ncbi:MAG: SGNH/GDSL hydrolase family protein [Xenococcaceae cyanobacterium]
MNFSLLVDDYYILGDSLSDVNNFVSFTEGFLPTTPLFFPGQFTNGRVNENGQPIPNAQGQTEGVWVEYFTQELNLKFSSFYQDRNNVDTTKDGINFAIGAATSGDANIGLSFPDDENGSGLREQLNDLTATVDSLEDDLVFVWVGANDYFADELIGKNGKEYILGLNGKDKIVGGTGDDLIDGGNGKDRLFGEEGDDTFIGGTGKDLIDGGTGTDTAVYDGSIDNFTFKGTADCFQVKGMGLGKDTLIDVEFLKFQDGVFATSDLLKV